MATWEAFRDGLCRSVLGDVANPARPTQTRFSDDLLLTFANAALLHLARTHGPLASSTITGTGGVTYDIPADALGVVSILNAQGQFVKRVDVQNAIDNKLDMRGVSGGPQVAYLSNWPSTGSLTFVRPIPANEVYTLSCRTAWTPLAEDDDMPDFFGAPWLELALAFYIGYLAYVAEAAKRSALEQWATRPDMLVDNPLEQQASYYRDQYERLLHANG